MGDLKQSIELFLWIIKKRGANGNSMALWLYIYVQGPAEYPLSTLTDFSGLRSRTIRGHIELLSRTGFLSVTQQIGKSSYMKALCPTLKDLKKSLNSQKNPGRDPGRALSLDYSLESLEEYLENLARLVLSRPSKSREGEDDRGHVRGQRVIEGRLPTTASEIRDTTTWKEGEPSLYAYFNKREVQVKALLSESKFKRLKGLIEDSTFDFPLYCQWYRENKYARLKFKWSMFLLASMLEEFRDEQEGYRAQKLHIRPDQYWNTEDKRKRVEQDKEWLDKLPDVEDFE